VFVGPFVIEEEILDCLIHGPIIRVLTVSYQYSEANFSDFQLAPEKPSCRKCSNKPLLYTSNASSDQ